MSYIGREPAIGNYQVCDALTASATATYALAVGSTSVSPESANHVICSLNGVIQKPVSSFTISGSNIVFNSALTSSDSIDFILLLGSTLDVGIPSDASITNAKLASDVISGETDIGAGLADADLILVDDGAGGTLRKSALSRMKTYIGGGVNTPAFMARLSGAQSIANGTHTTVVFQTEDFDVGSDYDTSTGIFTCGEAGKYLFGGSVFFQDANGNLSDMIGYVHSTISSSASQDLIVRSESTSNGTLHTEKSNSWTQLYTLGVGDAVKIIAYQETNNNSACNVSHGRKSYFWGMKIIE